MRVGFRLFHQKSGFEPDEIRNFNVLRPIFAAFRPS